MLENHREFFLNKYLQKCQAQLFDGSLPRSLITRSRRIVASAWINLSKDVQSIAYRNTKSLISAAARPHNPHPQKRTRLMSNFVSRCRCSLNVLIHDELKSQKRNRRQPTLADAISALRSSRTSCSLAVKIVISPPWIVLYHANRVEIILCLTCHAGDDDATKAYAVHSSDHTSILSGDKWQGVQDDPR